MSHRKLAWASDLLILALAVLATPVAHAQTLGMVVDDANGNVIVFDADTDTVVGSVSLSGEASVNLDCALLDDQSLGFVNNFDFALGSKGVWVIDPGIPTLAAGTNPILVSTSSPPLDLTISADQRFVLTTGGFPSSTVSVLDIAGRAEIGVFTTTSLVESVEACSDDSVLATATTTGLSPGLVYRLTIDGAGNLTDTGENDVLVGAFNVACGPSGGNGVVVTDVPASAGPGSLQSYGYPPLTSASSTTTINDGLTVVISPDGSTAYSRAASGGAFSTGFVEGFTYDEATGALGAAPFVSFPVADNSSYLGVDHMALHPNGSKLYVSEGPNLNVYDPATGALLTTITDAALVSGAGVCLPAIRVIELEIDVKPGSDPNSIPCDDLADDADAMIPVAILTTDDFDATTVDHTTVVFEGATEVHVRPHTGEVRRHEKDADGDGDVDLVFHFILSETDLTCDATEGLLTGQTFGGQPIEGSDSLRFVLAFRGCGFGFELAFLLPLLMWLRRRRLH